MHLLSCEHPHRVFNKYINEYVWVTCGKCNSCKNAKAFRWTDALERERLNSRYALFVTLTFDDFHLPLVGLGYYPEFKVSYEDFIQNDVSLVSVNVPSDDICIPFSSFCRDNYLTSDDINLFFGLYKQFGGIPYASKTVLQNFNKRLNKYFHDKVTNKFKNFRYFCVSEYGSTTLRPHFHGIYFTNDSKVARCFREAVSVSWKQGIIDCQYVENSACSYVAQYINKHSDLPLFYQKGELSTKYWFSKRPIIGARYRYDFTGVGNDDTQALQEILNNSSVTCCISGKANSTKPLVVPLDKSTENYLFPKCDSFKQISNSLRIELYTICLRFVRKTREGFKGFLKDVISYMVDVFDFVTLPFFESDLARFLYEKFYKRWLDVDEKKHSAAYEWLRRVYYLSRKFMRNCLIYKKSVKEYLNLIITYFDKKELYLLSQFYNFQQSYDGFCDDLVLMYPEYLHTAYNWDFQDYFVNFGVPNDVQLQIDVGKEFSFNNKKSHFKNAYFDSLELKRTYNLLFNVLKVYFYAKKCDETLEAFAS